VIGRFVSPFERAARMLRMPIAPRSIRPWSIEAAIGRERGARVGELRRAKAERDLARAEGRCTLCGEARDDDRFRLCGDCRAVRRVKAAEKYQPIGRGRLANGCCRRR
jgi:hypothetical protein